MESISCIILAAGLGKRMGGELAKASIMTREKALIEHVLEASATLSPKQTVIVTGHKKEDVEALVRKSPSASQHNLLFAFQEKQLGTGHAVRCALPSIANFSGTIVIMYADAPLIRGETLKLFVDFHQFKKATVSVISFTSPYPNPYGRILRNRVSGDVEQIVEAKDCNVEQVLVDEVNSGIYAVDSSFLKPAVESIETNNAQKEYYLTDIVAKATKEGQRVTAFKLHDSDEALGVNTPSELERVNRVLAQRRISQLIDDGILFDDPGSCFIDADVTIEPSAKVGPNVQLRGNTSVEAGVVIEGTAIIVNSSLKRGAHIRLGCRIEDTIIMEEASVGPFAHLRPGTSLGPKSKIGNFVETKNATVAAGAKASHLTYLGDCSVGEDANVGAGTITCNYDGYKKSKTIIGKGAFIGSNSALVAPVTIGNGATVGAGSVITSDVPTDALALTRAETKIVPGWSKIRREKTM